MTTTAEPPSRSVLAVPDPTVGRPMVGRTTEMARIRRLIRSAAAGTGGAVVVVGEPGAGKSRLVAAAADAATGMTLRCGRAEHHRVERTLGVALDAFDLRLDDLVGHVAATRIVLSAGASAAVGFLLADRMLEVVEQQCARGPLLLVVEDLHWSDAATLTWLRGVVERSAALPLAVLVTTRPVPVGSAVGRTLDALGVPFTVLSPLSPSEVVTLAERVLGGPVDTGTAAALDLAGGNPLLVLAVLTGGGGPGARLGELDAAALRTVQVAAVLGPRVDPVALATVTGSPALDLLAHLDQATSAGILVADADRLAFRHELYRDAAWALLPVPARGLIHLQAARALARSGAPVLEVAEHYARGAVPGDRVAVRWLHDAAATIAAAAPAGALRLVGIAVRLADGDVPDDLMLLQVTALAGTGRAAEAERLGRSLLHGGLPAAVEAPLRRELAFTSLIQGRAADCVSEMQRCAELTALPTERARVHGELAFARFMAIDHAGARVDADRAVHDGRRHGDLTAQVAGDSVLCFLDLFGNRLADATRRARAITDLAEHPRAADAHAFQPWFIACLVHLETDELDLLAATARRGREVAVARGAGWAVPGYDAVTAFGALRAGALDDAAATAEATLAYITDVDGLTGVDGLGVAVWCHAFLAQVLLHRGDVDAADAHVLVAERWLTGERAQLGFEQVQLARAGVHERRGRPDAALSALRPAWDLFRLIGAVSPLPAIGPALVRLAHGAGDRALLDEAAAVFDDAAAAGTTSVRVVAELAAAWRDVDPDRALGAAALAERTPRPALVTTALTDAAALLRERGRRAEAVHVSGEAARRWSALGADADARTCAAQGPAIRRTRARPRFGIDALTGTERHVVALVADGLSNSAIAAVLGVSRRTVESHVSSAYRKVEVTSRVALTRVALAHGLSVHS